MQRYKCFAQLVIFAIVCSMLGLLTGCAGAGVIIAEEVIEDTAKEVIQYEENKHKKEQGI